MPPSEPEQEALPDFSTHPDYQLLFNTLVAGGQNREQATVLLTELWRKRIDNNNLQAGPQPQGPHQLQLPPGGDVPQQGQADQDEPQQRVQDLQPHQQPIRDLEEHPAAQLPDLHQGQAPQPFPPRDLPPLPNEDQDLLAPGKVDRRAPRLPAVNLDAESHTMSLLRPTTFAIEKLRRFEYVPLWYFTQQGRQAADKDRASNEDLWDVTKTSDNRLSLRTASSNRPSPNALSDEQLTWEQFMDANHLFCRWLIPAGWPEDYAKILLSFFWQLENHEDMGNPEGKETLLLYQARTRKAWHDELKADHFFNIAKLSEKKMSAYCKEVNAKHNDVVRKAVSPLYLSFESLLTLSPFPSSPYIPNRSFNISLYRRVILLSWMTGMPSGTCTATMCRSTPLFALTPVCSPCTCRWTCAALGDGSCSSRPASSPACLFTTMATTTAAPNALI
jgi:hypothetical protein